MKNDEGDVEDSAIDIESIVDSDPNVVNSKETDKDVWDTIFDFSDMFGKKVGDANKCTWGVEKQVDDTNKGDREVEKGDNDGDTTSDFLRGLGKNIEIKVLGTVYLFFSRRSKKKSMIILWLIFW